MWLKQCASGLSHGPIFPCISLELHQSRENKLGFVRAGGARFYGSHELVCPCSVRGGATTTIRALL